MKIITDLSITSAPHRARHGWHPGWLFRSGAQGAWFDPSDLATLFQDIAGTLPVASDGDPVALMLDKSGNDNHATQPVAAARPTWRSNGNLAWLEFDGVDDQMELPAIPYSAPHSLCLGLQRFASGTWGSFRSPLVSTKYAGLSLNGAASTQINNAGGVVRVNGALFTGSRGALYTALQSPAVGASVGNTDPGLHVAGTFFNYASLCPSGKVFGYVEAEGLDGAAIARAERWMADKGGVTL